MKLEVGMYVRTIEGYIAKIIEVNDKIIKFDRPIRDITCLVYDDDHFLFKEEVERYIVKTSRNPKSDILALLNLIEVGDFVNGFETTDFEGFDEDGNYEEGIGIPIYDDANLDCIVEYRPIRTLKITSILTKEQFKARAYEVGE